MRVRASKRTQFEESYRLAVEGNSRLNVCQVPMPEVLSIYVSRFDIAIPASEKACTCHVQTWLQILWTPNDTRVREEETA